MLSIRKLFEATLNMPQAQGPMDAPREYVAGRVDLLKKDRARGRISQTAFIQGMAAAQKAKNNKVAGTQQYPI